MRSYFSKKCIFLFTMLTQLCLLAQDSFDDFNKLFETCDEEVSLSSVYESLPGTNCFPAIDILRLITPENPLDPCQAKPGVCSKDCLINAPAILRENLYLKTTGPVTRRSLLDEPSLRYYCLDNCMWNFTITPFYNYSPRVFFTKDSPFIQTYIDLTNENVLNEITDALKTACVDVDVPGILGLFSNIKLQQHRAGAMFSFCKTFGNEFNLSFKIPLYYLIDHFFLTQEEIEAIENSPFLASLAIGPAMTSKQQAEKFGLQHLVADRVGLGDSRLNISYKIYETPRLDVWFGMQATIPTAVTIKEGIIGGKFDPWQPSIPFNIKKLFELYFCTPIDQLALAEKKITSIVTNFFVSALDRLTTILFDAPLGNGGHFGIGPQIDVKCELNSFWYMHTYIAVEGFFKHRENSFFLVRKKLEDFNRNFRNEVDAEENLKFLNDQVVNTFFPENLKIPVRPGIITKLSHSFVYDSDTWHGYIGFDYWNQRAEKLFVNKEIIDKFDVERATRPAAQQGKIFLGAGYRGSLCNNRILWDVTFSGDGALFHKGIGENYTFAINLGINF